jgi:F0F1-type ATP synthase membrane subunit b/b'
VSLEHLYEILRKVDGKVDEVYKLRDHEDAELTKLIGETRVKVQGEVEDYIKKLINEYKESKSKEIEEEVRKYSENLSREVEDFRKKLISAIDKTVEEVIKTLISD